MQLNVICLCDDGIYGVSTIIEKVNNGEVMVVVQGNGSHVLRQKRNNIRGA